MVQVVRDEKQGSRGSYSKLSIPDQILLTLQYWREYRTLFHLAQDWGVHESTAQGIVKRIEDMLIKSQRFSCKDSGLKKGNDLRPRKVTRMGRNSLTEKSHY